MSRVAVDQDASLVVWQAKRQGKPSVVARKRKVHRTTPYRWRDARTAKGSVEYEAMQLVRRLSDDPSTDAEPFITTLKVAAMTEYAKWDTDALIKEWHRLFNAEPLSDASEEVASRGTNWEHFIDQHMAEAALHTRLAAITQVLVMQKKVDPKQYTKDATRIIR
jgi:hypothetical protein